MNEEPTVTLLDVDGSEAASFRYEMDEDESPSTALVTVTSAVTGKAPTELEPLGRRLDLEALDELLESGEDETDFSASVILDGDGFSVAIDGAEIVGAASLDVVGWSRDGS